MIKVVIVLIVCAGGYYFWSQSDSRLCAQVNGKMVNGQCQGPMPKDQCTARGGKIDPKYGCVLPT
jgi:hypothetical protein